ncbi:MAG: hypothetical protein ACRD9S_06570 [Pyrinomonadaceae bacterium]
MTGKTANVALLFVLVVCAAVLASAQTSTSTKAPATIPAPHLEFVGKEAYEVNGAKLVRYKLSVTNRTSLPDFLWQPAPQLRAGGRNRNASRSLVEIFSSPGDNKLNTFGDPDRPIVLGRLYFDMSSTEKPPPCVYLVMTDRQTGKKYTSNRVCSLALTVAGSPQARSKAKGHEGSAGWIEIQSSNAPEAADPAGVAVLPANASEGGVTCSTRKLIALTKHETISVYFNPKELTIGKHVPWQKASVKLFDTQGNLIAENDRVALVPGKSRTISFKRDDLKPVGEKSTGRLQIEIVVMIIEPKSAKQPELFSVSLEIIDGRGVSRNKWPNLILKRGF